MRLPPRSFPTQLKSTVRSPFLTEEYSHSHNGHTHILEACGFNKLCIKLSVCRGYKKHDICIQHQEWCTCIFSPCLVVLVINVYYHNIYM